jgi:hypothetical protein
LKAKLHTLLFLFILSCTATPVAAIDGLSFSGGYDNGDEASFFRGAVKIAPEWKWFEEGDWYLGMHFDFGLIYIDSNADVVGIVDFPDSLFGISMTPVFRLQRAPFSNSISPFFEIAVGASLLSEDKLRNSEIDGIDLGGNFQFEDLFSIGLKFGELQQYEISLNYFHYSNAGIYDHNDGLNFASATFGVWF